MNHRRTFAQGAAVLAIAFAAGAAFAQAEGVTRPHVRTAPATMTDVAPLPAEDRDSHGAIVLHNQPVRAQKSAARAADTVLNRSRTAEAIAAQREAESLRLNEMGAGALIKK
jgi:hypothetical protein